MGFLLLLALGISLPASSAATKAGSLPMVKIVGHPARVSYDSKATFTFYSTYSDVDAYLCSLDGHNSSNCTLVKTYRGLEKGKHHFAVKLVSDGAVGPVTAFTWTIKNRPVKPKPLVKPHPTAPTVKITSHPSLNTASTTAAFKFSSNKAKATFKCTLSGSSATSCKPPTTYTGLTPGLHTFAVKASANGLSSPPATFSWYVSAVAPANTSVPAITGTVQVGQVVTASSGTWTGTQPMTYAYQWQVCSSGLFLEIGAPTPTGFVSCGYIPGATSSSYTIQNWEAMPSPLSTTEAEVGAMLVGTNTYTLRVVVTATNAGGQQDAVSSQTSSVLPAPPVNESLPSIYNLANPPVSGNVAYVAEGIWLNFPSFTYQWQRCDASGSNCSAISGATSFEYTLTAGDVGSTLRVVVTGSNPGGSAVATSPQTALITT